MHSQCGTVCAGWAQWHAHLGDIGGEAHGGGALARGVDATGRQLVHVAAGQRHKRQGGEKVGIAKRKHFVGDAKQTGAAKPSRLEQEHAGRACYHGGNLASNRLALVAAGSHLSS